MDHPSDPRREEHLPPQSDRSDIDADRPVVADAAPVYECLVEDDVGDTTTVAEAVGRRRVVADCGVLVVFGGAAGALGERSRIVDVGDGIVVGRGVGDQAARTSTETAVTIADTLLSKVHLRIERRGREAWWVEDAGSRNGTLLNGRRISEARCLSDGALLFFGSCAAVFRTVSAEARQALAEEAAAPFGVLPTMSPGLALLLSKVRRLARVGSEILLVGETGVGKEVYARGVHRATGRTGPFVGINCAAIPGELAESELFGYARGAHSTAMEAKPGLLQAASGGTLFLDEIGDLSQKVQAKLLRALEEREVTPLGATTPRPFDVQVVAATTHLAEGRGEGMLRPDLAARLGVEPVEIPPLRDRIEDLAILLPYFLADGSAREMEPTALRALCLYRWPRNVRELKKTLTHAAALTQGTSISVADLPRSLRAVFEPSSSAPPAPLPSASEAEGGAGRTAPSRAELEQLLQAHHGNVAEVARALDRRWHVVWRWLTKHRLEARRFRRDRQRLTSAR